MQSYMTLSLLRPKIIRSNFSVRKIQNEPKWKITPQTWIILPKWQCHVATSVFCVFSFGWISLTKSVQLWFLLIIRRGSKCESWWHRANQMSGALISKNGFTPVEHACVAFVFRTKCVESRTHKVQCVLRATNTHTVYIHRCWFIAAACELLLAWNVLHFIESTTHRVYGMR